MKEEIVWALRSVIDDIETAIDLIEYNGPHTIEPQSVFDRIERAQTELCDIKWEWEALNDE